MDTFSCTTRFHDGVIKTYRKSAEGAVWPALRDTLVAKLLKIKKRSTAGTTKPLPAPSDETRPLYQSVASVYK